MKRVEPGAFRQWVAGRGRRGPDPALRRQVAEILAEVADGGDEAVARWSRRLDGAEPAPPLDRQRLKEAWAGLGDAGLRRALAAAAERIEVFHRRQLPVDFVTEEEDGTTLGQRWLPLTRVGVYAPGGLAAYPSSILMGVIPASVAGAGEIWLATPPGEDGLPPGAMQAAAYLAGADYVLPVGGVQALAALAYGTESVPGVDALVGPGNAYVQEAKRQLFGVVAVDDLYGPSELAVLLAGDAEARLVAADLIAQVEHAPGNVAVLVGIDEGQLEAVAREVGRQKERRTRRAIIGENLEEQGRIVCCRTLAEAVELVEALAPEHLMLVGAAAEAQATRIQRAGALFVGSWSPVALGDYVAGTNHCLPTGGTARFASSLGTLNFLRRMAVVEVSPAACRRLVGPAARIAAEEGFEAHAYSLGLREEPEPAGTAGAAAPGAEAEPEGEECRGSL